VVGGLMSVFSAGRGLNMMLKACFAGDTQLLTLHGPKRIDEFKVGDKLLSRSEYDAGGAVEEREVLEVFVRTAPVWNLHVGGKLIRTTAEHPFYVRDRGWVATSALRIGDWLSSHDGQWVPVEGMADSGEITTVHNLNVAEYHTYFVGGKGWEFDVWAHNAYHLPAGSGTQIGASTTAKGTQKVQYLFRNRNDAMNWARRLLEGGGQVSRIRDAEGRWIGWKNQTGDTVYWGHGDWGKGLGTSTYPHLNYNIQGQQGHLFLENKIRNKGMWGNFSTLFGL
jgi:Pretoxin HINT domain